ncbi:MAG: hypothetical protein ACJ76N_21915 [Thermoanaerobaculia bacterium]
MRRLLLSGLLLGLLLLAGPAGAVNITIVNGDGAGEGFNDPTPVAPVLGNAGTTLGQQRLNVFMAAAAYWSNRLSSPVPITVSARMDPLTCSANSGILGSAGAADFLANFPNAPRAGTWYPSALANAFAGADQDPSSPEIVAQFNSRLGTDPGCLTGFNWWYGIGGTAPANTQSFYQTVVHEIAHGLGFLTVVNLATGARAQGLDDDFMLFLEDHGTGKTWPQMSNGERLASAVNSGGLHWTGPAVVAASAVLSAGRHPSGHVQMYAPSPVRQGSSVSHWDSALTADEILEPFATANPSDLLTTQLLRDLGWSLQSAPSGACVRDASTACLQSGRFEVKVDWQTASASGAGQVMSFGTERTENDESVFWWFFNPTNFELGVKTLNACGLNGKLWVFLSGLTDQGWTVHVRDTATGATRTYSNTVGHLSSTFSDVSAFNCP